MFKRYIPHHRVSLISYATKGLKLLGSSTALKTECGKLIEDRMYCFFHTMQYVGYQYAEMYTQAQESFFSLSERLDESSFEYLGQSINFAILNNRIGNNERALEIFLDIKEKLDNSDSLSYLPVQSMTYYFKNQQGTVYRNDMNFNRMRVSVLTGILKTYHNMDSIQQYGPFLEEFSKIDNQNLHPRFLWQYMNLYLFKSEVFAYEKNYEAAIKIIKEGIAESSKHKMMQPFLGGAYSDLSTCFEKAEKPDSAIYYQQKEHELNLQSNDAHYITYSAKRLSELYYKDKNTKAALEYLELYTDILSELDLGKKVLEINQREIERILLKEAKEKEAIEQKRIIIEKQIYAENQEFILLIFVIILILLTSTLIFYLKISKNKVIKKEKEELKLKTEHSKQDIEEMTYNLSDKINLLRALKSDIKTVVHAENSVAVLKYKFIEKMESHFGNDASLELMQLKLKEGNEAFLKRLIGRHGNLTEKEIQLSTFLRHGFSSRQISRISFVEERTVFVSRSRLRKKLQLDKGVDLVDYIKGM